MPPAGATVTWRDVSRLPLADLRVEPDGLVARARTRSWAEHRPGAVPHGIVPLSPATRGSYELVATTHVLGRADVSRHVYVTAAARATGVPSIATDQRIYLGGDDWTVREHPPGARGQIEMRSGLATLRPDARGRWLLADRAGHELALGVMRYDETRLDCGRPECHANETRFAARSPMTSILFRAVEGRLGAAHTPGCALGCHTLGEPGLRDGGFAHVAEEMDAALPAHGSLGGWDRLPRALRRLGGVGCGACHGPGSIPQRDARWAILRADVCAVCHDAPPRYGHVAAWRTNAMSRGDAALGVAGNSRCEACHSTHGFLVAIGARSVASRPPDDVGSVGVACAACHVAHARESGPALTRVVPTAGLFRAGSDADPTGRSRVCVRCHSPDPDAPWPEASAAAVILGRGARSIVGTVGGHARVPGGCIGCHRAGPTGTVESHGDGHAFRVDRAVCTSCHEGRVPPAPALADGRLLTVVAALRFAELSRTAGGADPAVARVPHGATMPSVNSTGAIGRVLYDVRLVVEDRGAAFHNAPFVRAVLAAAR